jgi:hypothetical protein
MTSRCFSPARHLSSGLLAILLLLIAGCFTPVRKSHLADLADLPRSKGFYGGSLLLGPPWLYFGSDARYHYFQYVYTRENLAHMRRLKIPRGELSLSFEHPFQSYEARGTEVVPIVEFGTVLGFVRNPALTPKDEEWKWRVAPLPTFDESL